MFTKAIVRPPGANFAAGLTTMDLGAPDHARALQQHEAYCEALQRCGLTLTRLEPDERHPDATFVEDTAVVTNPFAISTRPGASGRVGEVESMAPVLSRFYARLHFHSIQEPGTLDGGDVCQAEDHFFIGISERTNEVGAEQLAAWLAAYRFTSSFVDIRGVKNILHFKSGVAYLGNNRLVVVDALADRNEFQDYDLVRMPRGEQYAANCLLVNGCVLMAAGYPGFEATLQALGYPGIALEMTEFQKMDGGLSCLSLRF